MDLDKLEIFLQENILPDLDKGRPRDKAHTLLVATTIKEIVRNSPGLALDLYVLLIAAYAHDWGYTDLFDNKNALKLSDIGAQKEAHMNIGANKVAKFIENNFFNFLTKEQKERVVHLVGVHDKLDQLHDLDEIVLMEADSLGGLNSEIMGGFEEKASEERFMRKSRDLRLSRFATNYGKSEFERLYRKRMEYNGLAKK